MSILYSRPNSFFFAGFLLYSKAKKPFRTALSGDGAFEVAEITGGVVAPAAGLEVETHRGVTSLGRVETTDSGGGG